MRRFRQAFIAGTTCALLATVPVSAYAQAGGLRVGVRVTQGPWSATVSPAGRLPNDPGHAGRGLENDGGSLDTGPVIGGDTLATIGITSLRSQAPVLLLYHKGSAGWSHAGPPARFPFRGAPDTFSMAAADGLVAVNGVDDNGNPPNPACATPVFVAGSGGFSGRLTPAACLAGGVLPVAATPRMVVATTDSSSTIEIFTEPVGGWRGTVAPSATLQASNGDDLGDVSLAGSTIAAVGQTSAQVHLFTEPAEGWSGLISDSAQIQVPGGASVATLSGRTLTVWGSGRGARQLGSPLGVFVAREPVGGWRSATVSQPRAYVQTRPDQDLPQQGIVLHGTTAVTNVVSCGDQGATCSTEVWAINGLVAGAAAVPQLPVGPSASSDQADGTPLTSEETTLALGDTGIQLYTVAHTPPARVVRVSLTGVTAGPGRPVLRLRVAAGTGLAASGSARVLVPPQLGGRGVARVITLRPARHVATITLRRLSETAALRDAVRRIRAHGGRSGLTIPVELLDRAGRSDQSDLKVTFTR
jgi:hypothetical protein